MATISAAQTALRTHRAGSISRQQLGQVVRLGGWVHRRRDLGGLIFIDLRDRDGLVQLSLSPAWTLPAVMEHAAGLGVETVILVTGRVELRPNPARDEGMTSRDVEVHVTDLRVAGPAGTPAIPVARKENEDLASEELRLRNRVLDLRRPELQRNLVLRHRLAQRARQVLSELGFLEIETPILTKPTPEGARDYLVPSRVHPGEFYALPQSPQIYKQLLMVAGYDRYFQIARCFRDEDLRADRQPEFTQIDIEASFVSQDDVMEYVEAVLVSLWDEAGEPVLQPFPRYTYRDVMERYGIDKPDLRFGLEIADYTAALGDDAAPFLKAAGQGGIRFRAILAPAAGDVSRKDFDLLAQAAKDGGAGGLVWLKRGAAGWEGQGQKAVGPHFVAALAGVEGDVLVGVVGPDAVTSPALHLVRTALIRRLGLEPSTRHAFLWVVEFPLFEPESATGEHVFVHHPFTSPHPEDLPFLETDPGRCRAIHYDAVYNGTELGSGSIRITDRELQQRVFRLLGIGPEDQRRRFAFLLDALSTGAPPMGGFAVGFDRVVMLLAGAHSLRDVVAFPKTTTARALFEGAPTPVEQKDLDVLGLTVLGLTVRRPTH